MKLWNLPQPEHVADQSPPSSAKVLYLLRLHGMAWHGAYAQQKYLTVGKIYVNNKTLQIKTFNYLAAIWFCKTADFNMLEIWEATGLFQGA